MYNMWSPWPAITVMVVRWWVRSVGFEYVVGWRPGVPWVGDTAVDADPIIACLMNDLIGVFVIGFLVSLFPWGWSGCVCWW